MSQDIFSLGNVEATDKRAGVWKPGIKLWKAWTARPRFWDVNPAGSGFLTLRGFV